MNKRIRLFLFIILGIFILYIGISVFLAYKDGYFNPTITYNGCYPSFNVTNFTLSNG